MSQDRRLFCHVVGTRPNIVKAAPVIRAMNATGLKQLVAHTGQHYDAVLSSEIERDVGLNKVNKRFSLKQKTQPLQIGEITENLSAYFSDNQVTDVIVYGDVTSTLAGALAAKYRNLGLIHVEAGLRSGDNSMPEEINRIVVDSISDILFTTTKEAFNTLEKSKTEDQSSYFVGNTMIDSLFFARENLSQISNNSINQNTGLVTIHRQSNVDDSEKLGHLVEMLNAISKTTRLIFPVHPRTKGRLEEHKLISKLDTGNIEIIEPLPYIKFVTQMIDSKFVITDSGGIQEEAAALNVPAYILRDNTERDIAISSGRAKLISPNSVLESGLPGLKGSSQSIDLWDGNAAERIASILS